MARRERTPPADPRQRAEEVLSQGRVHLLPIKHHSPVVALHVGRWIRHHRPAVVLVEGPEEGNGQLEWLLHPDTRPPVAVLTRWADRKAGTVARSWYPLTGFAPEWAAMSAAREVGAEVRLIDAPLKSLAPLGLEARGRAPFLDALASRGFQSFWWDRVEGWGPRWSSDALWRVLATLAACERTLVGEADVLEADRLREAHMRWHLDRALEEVDGTVVVVLGAWHAVALPWVKGRRAGRPDAATRAVVARSSHQAMSRWDDPPPAPGWAAELLRRLERGDDDAVEGAAIDLLVGSAARWRATGGQVGTADVVAAWTLARNLSAHRGRPGPSPDEVEEAVLCTWVKDRGVAIARAAFREAATGDTTGFVPEGAGRPPLVDDFWAKAREHRLDLGGAPRQVRLDVGKNPTHRDRSAFLHCCLVLAIPMFHGVDAWDGEVVRAADPTSHGRQLLLAETWSVLGSEAIDDRLFDLSTRGDTVEAVTSGVLRETGEAARDVRDLSEVLLAASRCGRVDLFVDLGVALERALALDRELGSLLAGYRALTAIASRRHLSTYRDERVEAWLDACHAAACGELGQLAGWPAHRFQEAVDGMADLMRGAVLAPEARSVERLLTPARHMAADLATPALVRGACCGWLHACGRITESRLAAELVAASRGSQPADGAHFLEGILRTRRSTLLASERLLAAVDQLLLSLDDDAFVALLPDIRRAFTSLSPAELASVGRRVVSGFGAEAPMPRPGGRELAASLEARVDRAPAWRMKDELTP